MFLLSGAEAKMNICVTYIIYVLIYLPSLFALFLTFVLSIHQLCHLPLNSFVYEKILKCA